MTDDLEFLGKVEDKFDPFMSVVTGKTTEPNKKKKTK